MRLNAIELEEFRGWVTPRRIELDASVVVVYGANGTGKTSLFDAVLWALTGEIPRLGDEHKHDVRSLYGESGHTRVRLELADSAGEAIAVTRSSNGSQSTLLLEGGDGSQLGEDASTELVRRLWPHGGTDRAVGMASTLARAVYLQQDDVRRFVEADTDADRFSAVAELVGAGVYGEVQRRMESERNSWSRALTDAHEEAARVKTRASQLEVQLESLSETPGAIEDWDDWRALIIGVAHIEVPSDPSDPTTPAAVDTAVRTLDSATRSTRRRLDQIEQLLEEYRRVATISAPSPSELDDAARALAEATSHVEALRSALSEAQQEAAAIRDDRVRLQDDAAELASMATLAVRHLGDRCPVCEQTYDRQQTESHLRQLMDAPESPARDTGPSPVPEASARLKAAESLVAERSKQLAALREAESTAALSRRALFSGIEQLGMAVDGDVQLALATDQIRTRERLSAIQHVQGRGEEIAVRLARLAEYRRREQTIETLRTARTTLAKVEADIARREAIGASASQVIEALRSAADDLVSNRVEALTPLLVRMYSRVDPHPGFQTVELLSRMWRGRGRLNLRLRDSVADIESRAPHVVLSSSQLNALALSVFLTFNLGIPRPPLKAVVLDDPLQSLDEINLLGVVDLLRRLKGERQVFVSTHDRNFAELLTRKLRPVGPEESLIVVRLEDWERHGPQIERTMLERETQPWRLANTA